MNFSKTRWPIGVAAAMALAAGCSRGPTTANTTEMTAAPPQAVAVPAAMSAAMPALSEAKVSIDNFSFSPPTVTVAVGTTVTWVNHDDVPHTVTADDKSFGSKAMDTDDRFSHAFTEPGTYHYYCAVHTHMTGIVVVK